jgi:hypothetical protein
VAWTAFGLLVTGPDPLCLDCRRYRELPNRSLRLDELRNRLLARCCPRPTRDAVWAELVRRSRAHGAAWTIGCVGVALPALTAVAAKLTGRLAGDRSDVHAEILRGFLTGLATVDVERPAVMTRLRWHAYRGGYAALREVLDAPMPYGARFDSTPPPAPVGHPDFVLARAVAEGAITPAEAGLIGTTRLEDVSLRDWAASHGTSYVATRQARSRGERRLVSWLSGDLHDTETGECDVDRDAREQLRLLPAPANPSAAGSTSAGRTAATGRSQPGRARRVQGCGRTPTTTAPAAARAVDISKGLRCA